MEFNAFSQLGQNDVFSTSPLIPQQSQQQQFQQAPPNVATQMMYSAGPYTTSAAATSGQLQSTALMHRRSFQAPQPYSTNTWTTVGGNIAKYPAQHQTGTAEITQRPASMTALSMRNLGMQSALPQANFLPSPMGLDQNEWARKSFPETDLSSLDPDMNDLGHGLMSTDEDGPIVDLRRLVPFDMESAEDFDSRRMSESSYSMSSNGPFLEVPTMEDYGAAEVTYTECDFPGLEATAQNNTSPAVSPRPLSQDLIRSGSRSRVSPIQHNNMRTSPYTLESNRNKRWSTGMYAPAITPPRPPPNANRLSSYYAASPLNPHNGLASFTNDSGMTTFAAPGQSLFYSQHRNSPRGTLFSSPNTGFPDPPRQLPSQSLFRLLPSHSDRLHSSSHFSDMSEPPDLYSSLHEEPSNPPETDMQSKDPDLVPHEQDLRFPGDMYTPRWVRGHGNKREGWCGLCKPGRWLVLKNSAFWYDKSFTHGVSAATGAAFQEPTVTRRTEGNADVWEGLCGGCGDWVSLVSSKKKGTTWFRHAYKCHTHAKVKDGPKRRRETNPNIHTRTSSVAEASENPGSTATATDCCSQSEGTSGSTASVLAISTASGTPTACAAEISSQFGNKNLATTEMESFEGANGINTSGPMTENIIGSLFDEHQQPLTGTRLSVDMETGKSSPLDRKAQRDDTSLGVDSGHPNHSNGQIENSSVSTPQSTPQLSNTTMSTPHTESVGGLGLSIGLGVDGLEVGMGMGMGMGTGMGMDMGMGMGIGMGFGHRDHYSMDNQDFTNRTADGQNNNTNNTEQFSGHHQHEMQDHGIYGHMELFGDQAGKTSFALDHIGSNLPLGQDHENMMNSTADGMHAPSGGGMVSFGGAAGMSAFTGVI